MNSAQRVCALREGVRRSFPLFARAIKGEGFFTPFHLRYYKVLDAFAHGRIKKLMISVPPQHGKSEGSTRLLPAYLLGLNPDLKIAIASYSDRFAQRFNREVQRLILSDEYVTLFPGTRIGSNEGTYSRTSAHFDVLDRLGSLSAVGRAGGLTGQTVDVMIMDDLYKDAAEGNSPLIRENVWDWYTSTVKTRTHNNSQELIVFTRWHEDDLIGRISEHEEVIQLMAFPQIAEHDLRAWFKLNFSAIKEDSATPIDPRQEGEVLWPQRHNRLSLDAKRNLDPIRFACMYQGEPSSSEGLLYGNQFQTYAVIPEGIVRKGNYTDTADTGSDYLCSICYEVSKDGRVYLTEVVYTQAPMEETEKAVARMVQQKDTRRVLVESNNGGRGFARSIGRQCPSVRVEWFHQSGNKESRILTNSATVLQCAIMPSDWTIRWPEFYAHLTTFRRVFKANAHDDAADALTGIVEVEILKLTKDNRIRTIGFTNV